MKKIFLVVIAVGLVALTGCRGGMSLGNYKVNPYEKRASYTGNNFKADVYQAADSTSESLHLVGIVTPVEGAKGLPKVTGTLTDTVDGGKQLDITVNTAR